MDTWRTGVVLTGLVLFRLSCFFERTHFLSLSLYFFLFQYSLCLLLLSVALPIELCLLCAHRSYSNISTAVNAICVLTGLPAPIMGGGSARRAEDDEDGPVSTRHPASITGAERSQGIGAAAGERRLSNREGQGVAPARATARLGFFQSLRNMTTQTNKVAPG